MLSFTTTHPRHHNRPHHHHHISSDKQVQVLNLHKHAMRNKDYFNWLTGTDQFSITVQCLKNGEFVPREIHERTTQIITVHKGGLQVIYGGEGEEDSSSTEKVVKVALVGEDVIVNPMTYHKLQPLHGKNVKFSSYYFPAMHSPEDNRKRQVTY